MTRLDPISPGAQLAAARVRAGLSLDEVAVRSRVPREALEALEGDDWAGLPAPVYARGFVRLYAREVGLDPEPLLRLVDAGRVLRRSQAVEVERGRARQRRRARWTSWHGRTAVAVAVGALLVMVLAAVFGSTVPLVDVSDASATAQP